ncbi:MAG: hypothetical protein JJU02_00720 [Cryomorphaceae bacterium]|nr:hypothetical protein [Cryomorphaceae bacterium]
MHPDFEFEGRIIRHPDDVKTVPINKLEGLARALRLYLMEIPVDKPAHLASSLSANEITVALHWVMDLPNDVLVYDVGHQSYGHKVLTGRGSQMHLLRRLGGPSGFPNPEESPFDLFISGHSSTSLSTLAGMAYADRLAGVKSRRYVSVIGDGSLTAGVAFEALNFIGEHQLPVSIILNDNNHSIDDTRGALHLNKGYEKYFSALSIGYKGLENGHNVQALVKTFSQHLSTDKPLCIHCKTLYNKPQITNSSGKKTIGFSAGIADYLESAMAENAKLVLVSPAMIGGAGWLKIQNRFPDRVIDVGIAEQHAVAMCSGLVASGYIPVCHIYSTFLQRAFDQVIHDIVLSGLPVIFLVDRAGLVGEDGPTHHGLFDLPLLLSLPKTKLFLPTTPQNAIKNLTNSISQPKEPVFIRYPRDNQLSYHHIEKLIDSDISLVYYGAQGNLVEEVEDLLSRAGVEVSISPIEEIPNAELTFLATKPKKIVFFNEGYVQGGVGVFLENHVADVRGYKVDWLQIGLPEVFISHGNVSELRDEFGLQTERIVEKILDFVGN